MKIIFLDDQNAVQKHGWCRFFYFLVDDDDRDYHVSKRGKLNTILEEKDIFIYLI